VDFGNLSPQMQDQGLTYLGFEIHEGKEGSPMARLEDYTIVIRPDDNGTFVAYVPAIQGCHAWGRTSEEARAELKLVFEMILEEYKGEDHPCRQI
jgi:predicted RNase H-like HicB family nuclease